MKIKLNTKKSDIDREVYSTDASQIEGNATKVLIPEKVEEIKLAMRQSENIVPRGGGSGLVGGAVPQNSLVIDLSKLNKIIKVDSSKKTVYVEAGIILLDLQEALKKHGLEFPVDPSSHTICTIGGMIATNAVGNRGVKYGDTKNWVLEAEIIDGKGELKKINKIEIGDVAGMEGITGIIVRAKLKLVDIKERTADIIEEESIEIILEKVKELKRDKDVSMIEFFGKKVSGLLEMPEKYHLVVEYESDKGNLKAREYGRTILIRKRTYPVLADKGYKNIEDPKVYSSRLKEFIEWLEKREIPFFGHLGSGILHPCFKDDETALIAEMIKFVKKIQGQISGEHGIGLKKREFLEPADKKVFLSLKKRYDPQNKINKGKLI